jgi:hypothetical protein
LDEIKREVGSIITELNQTTDRNIELVEDRITRLGTLIERADQRIKTLNRETVRLDRPSAAYNSRGRASVPDSVARDSLDAEPAPVKEPVGEVSQPASVPQGSASPSGPASIRQQVRMLYLQGLPLERIATRVGKSVGEVELILSLHQGEE